MQLTTLSDNRFHPFRSQKIKPSLPFINHAQLSTPILPSLPDVFFRGDREPVSITQDDINSAFNEIKKLRSLNDTISRKEFGDRARFNVAILGLSWGEEDEPETENPIYRIALIQVMITRMLEQRDLDLVTVRQAFDNLKADHYDPERDDERGFCLPLEDIKGMKDILRLCGFPSDTPLI